MKDLEIGNRCLSRLSALTLVTTAMLALSACTIVVDSSKKKRPDETGYEGRARVGLGWHLAGESLDRYRSLEHREHERFDRRMWARVLDGMSEDGHDRLDLFRPFYNAPQHHQAHEEPESVRTWLKVTNVIPTNPHDIDEDPDEVIYIWEDGVEYCVHEHEVLTSPTPFTVTLPSSEGRITARVKLSISWRLSENYPGVAH